MPPFWNILRPFGAPSERLLERIRYMHTQRRNSPLQYPPY